MCLWLIVDYMNGRILIKGGQLNVDRTFNQVLLVYILKCGKLGIHNICRIRKVESMVMVI